MKYHIVKPGPDIQHDILKALPKQYNTFIISACFFKCSNFCNILLTLSLLPPILLIASVPANIKGTRVANYPWRDGSHFCIFHIKKTDRQGSVFCHSE